MTTEYVNRRALPADLSPVNLLAYLGHAFGNCGCSEVDEVIATIVRLLEWLDTAEKPSHATLYQEAGIFYILAGIMNDLDLAEHGGSIRWGWLTPDGKRLMAALKEHSAEAIDAASGEAYDGCTYGD